MKVSFGVSKESIGIFEVSEAFEVSSAMFEVFAVSSAMLKVFVVLSAMFEVLSAMFEGFEVSSAMLECSRGMFKVEDVKDCW